MSFQEETISPLLKLLKVIQLDSLLKQSGEEYGREDLESLLHVKYAPLFTPIKVLSNTTVHALLQQAIAFISARFN